MRVIQDLLRSKIKSIKPYSSARDEYSGVDGIFLDANENPIGSAAGGPFNRYPDPYQREVKQKLAPLKGVSIDQIFLGNGSDEAIDLVFRAFCEPRVDNVIILPPTYGMYRVCADINDVEVKEVCLTLDYQIDVDAVLSSVDEFTKAIWLCSPNNPTGNLLRSEDVHRILKEFDGLVIVDEAYIDFAGVVSMTTKLSEFKNLIILQTFSKAWGMAGLRIGMAIADSEIISVFNKIKYPYNLNSTTQVELLKALSCESKKESMVSEILEQRAWLVSEFQNISAIEKIYPSNSNSLLIKIEDAHETYNKLIKKLVVVRDRSNVKLCEGCLRITVGTQIENETLIAEIKNIHIE